PKAVSTKRTLLRRKESTATRATSLKTMRSLVVSDTRALAVVVMNDSVVAGPADSQIEDNRIANRRSRPAKYFGCEAGDEDSPTLCYARRMPSPALARRKANPAAGELLPLVLPVVAGLDIGYAQRIASGGDFLDLLLTSSARLLLMLLDISGRNTETIATSVQRLFRQRAAELFTTDANDSEALTVLTLEVNREIL